MFKLIVLLTVLGTVFAYGSYGSYGSRSSGYGSSYGRVIPLAVQSRRSIKYVDVPTSYGNYEPLTLEIPASSQPLNFRMPTKSSPINVETYHQPSRGSYAETSSVDEPHVRKHTVYRQIHSHVNEIVTPYRSHRVEVQPLQEQTEQVVARKAYGSNSGGYSRRSGGYGRY